MPKTSPKVDASRRPDEARARKMCDICGRYYQKKYLKRQNGLLKCPTDLDEVVRSKS